MKASFDDTSDILRRKSQLSLCKWRWYIWNKKLRHDDIFGIENANDGGGEKGEHDPRSGENEERSSMRRPSPSPLPVTSIHKKLQSGEINIKGLGKEGRTIRCPFCIGKKIKLHESRQLLQHAEGIWKSSKRKSKERGNHHALARYLKDTVLDHVRVLGESSEPLMCYPWTGILVVKGLDKEGRFTKQYLTDKLKRFKPIDIVLLENKVAPTGEAIIKFHKDYDGYSRLLQFHTFYARERHGKKEVTISVRLYSLRDSLMLSMKRRRRRRGGLMN
ncbi:hypothetical protein POM88_033127 [Heracleum sosnowskyi]|uniref:Uncharacterized protein n=1 Tax=Heracleum sosnowskyi TaxID=360622 RepID=A0AAD8I1X1_9APIA|nr:hypothetical protein POM88_033127 [Heracleum sosnowskyi]